MKFLTTFFSVATLFLVANSLSAAENAFRIQDYNSVLPYWGFSWTPSSNAISQHYASFYTGFAARNQTPERIHIRTARGNQTRMTVILDDQTLIDYLFDLTKRYEVYKKFSTPPAEEKNSLLRIERGNAKTLQQMEMFFKVLESPEYEILNFVQRAKEGQEANESIYLKARDVLGQLNPGRVFDLKINLSHEFDIWGETLRSTLQGRNPADVFTKNSSETVIAINNILWGRINYTGTPSDAVVAQLVGVASLAASKSSEVAFKESALKLFKLVTGSKYTFSVIGSGGGFQPALQCADINNCVLSYSEFSTIYPTGSAEDFTSDQFGNRIPVFYTPGLWQFLAYSGKDFDNIRKEPYYAFAPKMDFEGIGNGFHNPAVTFWGISKGIKQTLGIPVEHTSLGAVKRGGVSHGCLRLSTGHVWEMRQMLPVESIKATQVHFFGNDSKDFDLFDIDGDGDLEVMGVEYMISYGVQGASGLARREGADLVISNEQKLNFYTILYGRNNVFTYDRLTGFSFQNPSVSIPSHLDFKRKSVKIRITFQDSYPLYEQTYEKDKIQFYVPVITSGLTEESQKPLSKRIVRLMGRIKGCAPTSNKELCGEAAFDKEAQEIWSEAYM